MNLPNLLNWMTIITPNNFKKSDKVKTKQKALAHPFKKIFLVFLLIATSPFRFDFSFCLGVE